MEGDEFRAIVVVELVAIAGDPRVPSIARLARSGDTNQLFDSQAKMATARGCHTHSFFWAHGNLGSIGRGPSGALNNVSSDGGNRPLDGPHMRRPRQFRRAMGHRLRSSAGARAPSKRLRRLHSLQAR